MVNAEQIGTGVSGRQKRRLFYGWWIVLVCAVALLFFNGVGFYSFSAFLPHLVADFHNRVAISAAATLYQGASGVYALLVGWAVDRFGPRLLMPAGAGLMGVSLLVLSRAEAIWQIYLAYLLLALGSSGIGLVVVGATLSRWFVRRRSLALGLALTCLSLGGTVFLPLDTWLIGQLEWRGALVALAAGLWIVLIPLSALVLRRRPADLGLQPDGDAPRPAGVRMPPTERSLTPGQALRSSAYWFLIFGFTCVTFVMTGVLLHQVAYLTDLGFSAGDAATALSITTTTSVASRLALGFTIDRIPKKYLLSAGTLLQGLMLVLIVVWPVPAVIYPAMIGFGLTLAVFGVLQPLIMADYFGPANLGKIMGSATLITALITGFGSTFAGFLRESTGSYTLPFLIFFALELAAAAVVLLARRPRTADA